MEIENGKLVALILVKQKNISEIKSKVVCMHGVSGNRKWKIGGTDIGETEEYKYIGSDSKRWSKWWG